MSLTAVMTMREMLRPKCCSNSASSLAMIAWRRTGRDAVVVDDDASLGGELADLLAVAGEEPRDGVGLIGVERADLRQVVGVREQHAADGAKERGDQEEGDDDRLSRHADDDAPALGGDWSGSVIA